MSCNVALRLSPNPGALTAHTCSSHKEKKSHKKNSQRAVQKQSGSRESKSREKNSATAEQKQSKSKTKAERCRAKADRASKMWSGQRPVCDGIACGGQDNNAFLWVSAKRVCVSRPTPDIKTKKDVRMKSNSNELELGLIHYVEYIEPHLPR